MAFKCTTPILDPVKKLINTPWVLAIEPFQVSPCTWYVSGQKWVGCYLIDTGEGLILIDTGIAESLYLLVDSIYKTGHDPKDIKKILISHAHQDHFGGAAALQALSGAEIYMSSEDTDFYYNCPEETSFPNDGWHIQGFKVDHFYDDEIPIQMGNISIRTLLTPGHTIGCTSFFWKENNPVNNELYTVAMHGGVGANTMNDEYYKRSIYLTPKLRQKFIDDAADIKSIHVDIALPSHPNQIEILDRAGSYTHESQPYLDDTVWADFITERVRQVQALMK